MSLLSQEDQNAETGRNLPLYRLPSEKLQMFVAAISLEPHGHPSRVPKFINWFTILSISIRTSHSYSTKLVKSRRCAIGQQIHRSFGCRS